MQTNKNMLFAVLKGVRRGIEYLFLGGENLDDALRRLYSYRRRLIDFNILYADEIVSLQDKPSAELTLAEMPMMISVDELLTAEKSDARLGDSKRVFAYVIGRLRFRFMPNDASCGWIGVIDVVLLESCAHIAAARKSFMATAKTIVDMNYFSDDYAVPGETVFHEEVSLLGITDLFKSGMTVTDGAQDKDSIFNTCMSESMFRKACEQARDCEQKRMSMGIEGRWN